MAQAQAPLFPISLYGPAVRSGLHDKTLQQKRLNIARIADDALTDDSGAHQQRGGMSKMPTPNPLP